MVVPSRLPPDRATAVCAQCHSLRDVSAAGFVAGADYFDHFLPVLEYGQKEGADPPYWPDGRPRRFSNDAAGLWQSACFVKGGATCTTCHLDPHLPDVERNPQLAASENRLCLSCHAVVGTRLQAHTRHRPDSAGSACVECHMPPTVVSIKARMRDHAISVPSPEATVRFGMPNACNACHQDRDAQWARRTLQAWGVKGESRTLHRAAAFAGARRGERGALDALLALAADRDEPPLVRANAVGHLRRYEEPRASTALQAALQDPHALPRAVAAFTLAERAEGGGTERLVAALGDPSRVVRMAAAFALVNRRVTQLPGEEGRRLQEAKRDHLARADLLLDHAPSQLDRGKLLLLDGDAPGAAGSFSAALKLDPLLPGARYLLGVSLAALGREGEALAELRRVPEGDPFFAAAQKMARSLGR
jgi:predicted CXXCH cytochrome family protein